MDLDLYNTSDGLAYADGLLIYNVIAYDLSANVFTAADIEDFFKKFGAVLKVELLDCNTKCLIYFVDPKDAAEVLQKNSYFHKGHCIRVAPCDGYNQPDGAKLIYALDRVRKSGFIKTPQNALILNLNDDCLEHIFKNLSGLIDKINFALTCQRFYQVMVMRSNIDYALLSTRIFDGLTMWRTQIFLQIVGPQVKILEVFNNKIYEMLGSYCANVEKLEVDYCSNTEFVCKLIRNMHLLQQFEICGNASDDLFKCLLRCKNLKSLTVKGNHLVTGKYIHLLVDLEKLAFSRCGRSVSKYFQEICKNLKKLHYLGISFCDLRKDDYEHISEYLLELKTLICDSSQHITDIVKSPNIKLQHLEMFCTYHSIDIVFENLAAFQANQLECLKLGSNRISLEVATSVGELRKLKVLHLREAAVKDEDIIIFSQLAELEEINFENCEQLAGDSLLQLLEKCLKLKHLQLEKFNKLSPEFLRIALELLQDQRSRSLRLHRMNMHFVLDSNAAVQNALTELNKFPDVLQINVQYLGNTGYSDEDNEPYYNDYDYYDYHGYCGSEGSDSDYF